MSHEPMKKKDVNMALAVIDVQKKFIMQGMEITAAIENINKAVTLFRENDRPVIFICFDGPSHNSKFSEKEGDECVRGIVLNNKDIIVHKEHINSFLNTRLNDVMTEFACDALLIAGVYTQACVVGTYYGAIDNEISPFLLVGGIISTEERFNEAAYTLCRTLTVEEAEETIRTKKIPGSADHVAMH